MAPDFEKPGNVLYKSLFAGTASEWYFFQMKRMHTATGRLGELKDSGYVPGSMAERIGMVWPLTREVASLSKKFDVERRLQRHVAVLVRRGC